MRGCDQLSRGRRPGRADRASSCTPRRSLLRSPAANRRSSGESYGARSIWRSVLSSSGGWSCSGLPPSSGAGWISSTDSRGSPLPALLRCRLGSHQWIRSAARSWLGLASSPDSEAAASSSWKVTRSFSPSAPARAPSGQVLLRGSGLRADGRICGASALRCTETCTGWRRRGTPRPNRRRGNQAKLPSFSGAFNHGDRSPLREPSSSVSSMPDGSTIRSLRVVVY